MASFSLVQAYCLNTRKSRSNKSKHAMKKGLLEIGSKWLLMVGYLHYLVCFYYFSFSLFFIAFTITIASANSDTWASEIGSLSKRRPLSIKHFKQVEPGTSGAMSFLGTFAAIMGSFSIAIIAMLSYSLSFSTLFIIFVFGFLGNILDTLLGAFIQVTYRCPSCEMVVESKWHCNRKTVHMSGNTIVNNDLVNLSSCALASILGVLFFVTVAGG